MLLLVEDTDDVTDMLRDELGDCDSDKLGDEVAVRVLEAEAVVDSLGDHETLLERLTLDVGDELAVGDGVGDSELVGDSVVLNDALELGETEPVSVSDGLVVGVTLGLSVVLLVGVRELDDDALSD